MEVDSRDTSGLLRVAVADESGKVLPTIERLFSNDYLVYPVEPESFDTDFKGDECAPHVVLYLSRGVGTLAASRLERMRSRWAKTVVLLLMPTIQDESQLKDASKIQAHTIIFKPCTKKKIVDAVENYTSLMRSEECGDGQDGALLSCLMEFMGGRRPDLYVAYNRIMPLVMGLCQMLGYDWRYVQKVSSFYMVLLSNLDEELIKPLMNGEGRRAAVLKDLQMHIARMTDLLKMNPVTEEIGYDLDYVLKRYDGEGFPKDDVKEMELPVPSRMIGLLLDYHYLLQGGKSVGQALFVINSRKGWYDNVMVQSLVEMLGDEGKRYTRDVYPLGLVPGMVIAEDVYGYIDGKRRKIISRNEILTDTAVDYLQRHSEDVLDITEPVKVVEELYCDDGGDRA